MPDFPHNKNSNSGDPASRKNPPFTDKKDESAAVSQTTSVTGGKPEPTERSRILIVDDLQDNVEILGSFLSAKGYEIDSANDGKEALRVISEKPPDIVLLDLIMPELDGFGVCRRLKEDPATQRIPVIIITGVAEKEANVKAIESGADDFLIKPFDAVLLDARIRSSLRSKRLQDEIIRHQEALERRVKDRTAQVTRTQNVAVFSLAKLAESRDTETGEHLERMRAYAREIAIGLSRLPKYKEIIDEEFVHALYCSSPLHDIGKVGIPDRILLKPGKLTADEFDIMKNHSAIGGDTLRAADEEAGQDSFLAMGRDIAYYHHERWDGNGYPNGLKGEEIPLSARIVAVSDVYDALTSKRPYKEPMSHEKSRKIIVENSGSQFDPDIVRSFLDREQQILSIRKRARDSGEPSAIQRIHERLDQLETTQSATENEA